MLLALYLLAAFGWTFAIQNKLGTVTAPLRERIDFFDRMNKCTFCLGTQVGWWSWAGLVAIRGHGLSNPVAESLPVPLLAYQGLEVFAMGLAVGSFCYFFDYLIQLLELAVYNLKP